MTEPPVKFYVEPGNSRQGMWRDQNEYGDDIPYYHRSVVDALVSALSTIAMYRGTLPHGQLARHALEPHADPMDGRIWFASLTSPP